MRQKDLKTKRESIHYDKGSIPQRPKKINNSFSMRKIRKMNALPSWFLIISLIILCFLGTFNDASQSNGIKKENTKMVAVKIASVNIENPLKEPIPTKIKPKPIANLQTKIIEGVKDKKLSVSPGKDKANKLPKKTNSTKQKTKPNAGKSRSKKLTARELAELGKKHMDKVTHGDFPTMTISYVNPSSYINEMYDIGAKSIVYDESSREFSIMDLVNGDLLPFSRNEFQGFSLFKRVIKDQQWEEQKVRAASRLNTSPDSLEILLLVPIEVETRWVGHQVNLFRSLGVQIADVETVDANFRNGKLKVDRVWLKNGSSRRVNDRSGT